MSGLFVGIVDELGVLTFKQINGIKLTWTLLNFKDQKQEKYIIGSMELMEYMKLKEMRAKQFMKMQIDTLHR